MGTKSRLALGVLAAGVALTLLSGCTGTSSGQDESSAAAQSNASSSGATSTTSQSSRASGPTGGATTRSKAAQSSTPKDTYVAPKSAPYPTPSGDATVRANQTVVLNSLPGSRSQSCATVGAHTTVRAGSIAAGNFQTARKSFSSQYRKTEVPQLNLYVIPQHAKAMKKLTVKVRSLSGGQSKTVHSTQVEKAAEWRYYALVLPVKEPGSYRLTMSSGADKGCFDVRFAE